MTLYNGWSRVVTASESIGRVLLMGGVDEVARLEALDELNILDSAPELAFDEIAALAAQICGTPTALVTFVDANRQWFKARVGFGASETERAIAFCDHTIRTRDVFYVPDTHADIRFRENPLVGGEPRIRCYAGAPLLTPEGQAVGTVAVIDYVPRVLDDAQLRALQMLSRQASAQLELRRRIAETEEAGRALTAALVGGSLDCVIGFDHELRIVEFNATAEQTFGYTRDAALGQDLLDLTCPPDIRDAYRSNFLGYVADRRPAGIGQRLEIQGMHASGRLFPIEILVTRVGIDPPLFVAYLRDITDRKTVEEELRRSVERFEMIGRATNDVLYEWDLQSNAIWWNEAYARIYGPASRADATDYDVWLERLHPEDRERVDGGLRDAVERGQQAWSDEYRFRRANGTYATIFDRAHVMRDREGRPIRLLGAMLDITERRQLEQQIRQAQKMDAMGQLAGGIAHDFNNILTVIDLNHSALADALGPELRPHAIEIGEATARAAALTRQLLLVSRKQPAHRTRTDLNEVVGSMSRMLRRLVGEHIEFQTDPAAELPGIEADISMLEQVLLNLVINARDAMIGGGRLMIRTAATTVKYRNHLHGLELEPGRYVTLTVEDPGTGIAPEVIPHVFEPFFTTKEVGQGTGLGLSTVFAIVRQHRGAIEVTSRPGLGSTFIVYLPALVATAAVASSAPPPPPKVQRGHERILVVEDDPLVRNGVCDLLRRSGYDVLSAGSAVAAIDVWRAHRDVVDLVRTDMVMPHNMSGRDLAAAIHAERADVPVVFTSGYAFEHQGVGEPLVEGENFLAKPYHPSKLTELIRRRLDARKR